MAEFSPKDWYNDHNTFKQVKPTLLEGALVSFSQNATIRFSDFSPVTCKMKEENMKNNNTYFVTSIFSKFYGKVGVISCYTFPSHLKKITFYTEILTRKS